ncbi:MAG: 6,7-dimethyl-8-ribityllumazine synthase [Nevskiales bacterium]|nr:6,7-dimethyl-8-ribityllumazine synthase [Nevskiales bacterium]
MKKTGYRPPHVAKDGAFRTVRIAIVATRWNHGIVDALVAGARRCLRDAGVPDRRVDEFRAPGAFEIPLVLEWLARRGRHDGLVALGAVIRGDTPHFEYVAGGCVRGVQEVVLRHAVPLGFGVLTVNTAAQAAARAGTRDNKGYEAAATVLEMIQLRRQLDEV